VNAVTETLLEPLRWLFGHGPRTDLARGAVAAFLIRVSGVGLAFGVQVLLARALGLEAWGEYAFMLSWLLVLSLVSTLGLDSASLRFVATYRKIGDLPRLKGFLRGSQTTAAGSAVLFGFMGAAVLWLLRGRITTSLALTGWIACLALPVFVLLNLHSAILRGFKRIVPALLSVEILRPAALGVLVIGVYGFGGGRLTAPAAMAATLAAISAALAFTAAVLRRSSCVELAGVSSRIEIGAWLAVSLPLLLLGGFQILLSQTDILLVGFLLDTDRAGVYAVASRLSLLVALGLFAVNTIAAPMIAELWAAEERRRLQRLLTVSARALLIATLPLALGLALAGGFALRLFGEGFDQARGALLILIAGQLVNAASGVVASVMIMTGLERQAARIMGVVAALNLLLNGVLIPQFGIAGAALATASSTVVWNLAMLVTVWRRRRLNPSCLPAKPMGGATGG